MTGLREVVSRINESHGWLKALAVLKGSGAAVIHDKNCAPFATKGRETFPQNGWTQSLSCNLVKLSTLTLSRKFLKWQGNCGVTSAHCNGLKRWAVSQDKTTILC